MFKSSPSLNAALLNTLRYPYNTPEHRRNAFPALNLAQGVNCLRNMARPQTIASEFADAHFAASTINNYYVYVNYYCLRKQLALVYISQASKQLIVTLTAHRINILTSAKNNLTAKLMSATGNSNVCLSYTTMQATGASYH